MTALRTDTVADPLIDRSVETIRAGQAESGAYIASPTFEQYSFGWLRDGAYCALAMDAVGEATSAEDFHQWVMAVIHRQAPAIDEIVRLSDEGAEISARWLLPTRYHLNGWSESELGADDWPNFQLDGYGTWLFAFRRHVGTRPLSQREAHAVRLAARYLGATWTLPCFDYWEEFGDRRHTSTLASIAAGLRAAAALLREPQWEDVAREVLADIETRCTDGTRFVKGPDDARVDASLLSLSTPFELVAGDDPRMVATVEAIDRELTTDGGGVRRYVGDEYYGGSPWVLLTAWRGWHARRLGDDEAYARARHWVRAAADEARNLPEQRVDEPQLPEMVAVWEQRWGPAADPLLWSHAKYLLMERGDGEDAR